ncbi:hypothetical protein CYPRO_0759 [Cyclonatronum proteinivorum]|uniref:Uncharacterized protein n=1 Tax=Cyclonatronum proteinivorum TaxID=1457365 RepID=A0A345UHU0_9BACT|nr:hypothetical protein [Cyclonatronum proteinivorum]AXJ00042.1 hypothetical protein CYPRO_0759 [Cyclonatronum proteinivorum]
MSNTTLKAALSFLGLFVAGLVSGYFIAVVTGASGTPSPETPPAVQTEPDFRGYDGPQGEGLQRRIREMQDHMTEHLQLTEAQQQPLFEIIRLNHSERRNLMQQSRQQFRDAMAAHDAAFHYELATVLDQQQLAVWDSLYSREAQLRRQQQRGTGPASESGRERGGPGRN